MGNPELVHPIWRLTKSRNGEEAKTDVELGVPDGSTMSRPCRLPVPLASLCKTGCVYREKAFKHLACPFVPKTEPCAAPCKPDCSCEPKNGQGLVLPKNKTKNEVFLL
jgi:hypothetical protein